MGRGNPWNVATWRRVMMVGWFSVKEIVRMGAYLK
jgi:hypothetical protein